ncbi:MAG TPA: adenylate/guanylate cyclase domain-containing protein, partial [Burkholderiales bacterium]|nr:adenylate/guanylate cyclase domain-containing protein [Burkholderiales bacterium]
MGADLGGWLQQLGFGQYAEVFEREQIDLEAARHLTDANLKDLGLPMGHRVKFLAAMAAAAETAGAQTQGAGGHASLDPVPLSHPDTSAASGERRNATVVFSDLAGYTALNERLDPEEVESL